jgi:hypothetical protein
MNRKAIAWLAALISVSSTGRLTSQESGTPRDQWYERGTVTRAPASSAAAMIERQLRGRGISDSRILRAHGFSAAGKICPERVA